MDDNSSNDDEVKESPLSPIMGGKKLKLNDGSSQESSNGSGSSSKVLKDENADSGVSADKSESTSSEERAPEPLEGPSNVLVNAAASSNIHGIVLNIRRPKLGRCYRKRKTPDRDSDSDNSARDSDDFSETESPEMSRRSNNSDAESLDNDRLVIFPEESRSPSPNSDSNQSSATNYSHTSSELNLINSDDSGSEDDSLWTRASQDTEGKAKTDSVMAKARPKHSYFILREVLNREMGLTYPCGKARKEDVMFEQKFYGSLHSVYRLKKLHHLNKHKGCVNAINFHPEGRLLASGSDDTNVVVWDWARQQALQTIKTGHKSNVFQSKFLYLNARSQLNIVTCARDGQVRLLQCPPSGGGCARRRLAAHGRAAHKLHVSAAEPHLVVSAGEDGLVMQSDVRKDLPHRLFHVKESSTSVPLYSVAGHPLDPRLLCVAGRDRFVRVLDSRQTSRPLALYCPHAFSDPKTDEKKKFKYNMMHLTCAIFNHDGSQLLGSYNDEDIYLFDTKNDVYDASSADKGANGYTHRYSGHRNSATFKGVAFFGPRSQYVVSGSDCSHIYVWDKETEAIVQWMQGDKGGVVNCIEAHPRSPVLASSGLDKDIKIWIPSAQEDPDYAGLENTIRENSSTQRSPLFSDFLPTLYNVWRGENRMFTDESPAPAYGGNIEFDGNVCTAF